MRAVIARKDTSGEIKAIFAVYVLLFLFCAACAGYFLAVSIGQDMRPEIFIPLAVLTAMCAVTFGIWAVRYLPVPRVFISYDGESLYLLKERVSPSAVSMVSYKAVANKRGAVPSFGKLTVYIGEKKRSFYCVAEVEKACKRIRAFYEVGNNG